MKIKWTLLISLALSLSPTWTRAYPFITYDYFEITPATSTDSQPNRVFPVRLMIPSDIPVIRGFLIEFNGAGGDTRNGFTLSDYNEFIHRHGFGFIGTKNFEYAGPVYPTQIIQNVCDSFVKTSAGAAHPEVANAPFVLIGFSAGGGAQHEVNNRIPQRVIAFSPVNGGYGQPGSISQIQQLAILNPGTFMSGEMDPKQTASLQAVFDTYRPQGALWSFLSIQGLDHHWVGQSVLGIPAMDHAMQLRYPANMNPLNGPVQLLPLSESSGWLADNSSWKSGLTKIYSYNNYPGNKSTASWLIDQDIATIYRAYSTYDKKLTITSPVWNDGNATIVNQGNNLPVTVDVSKFPNWTTLQLLSGAQILGTVTKPSAPQFTITNISAGLYPLSIWGTDSNNNVTVSTPTLVVVPVPNSQTSNPPPLIDIISPAINTNYAAPATIPISLKGVDLTNKISKIDIFRGSTLLTTLQPNGGIVTPSFTWSNVPAGTYILTAKATDDQGASMVSPGIKVVVNALGTPVSVVTTSPLKTAIIGSDYSQPLVAAGGNGIYTWTLLSGTIPNGLSFNSSGVINGHPAVTTNATLTLKVSDSNGSSAQGTFILTVSGTSSDTQPPTSPTNLTGSAGSAATVNLSWNGSTDNVAVSGYKIFRNGNQVGTTNTTSFQDTGLSGNTSYNYTVQAFDAAGNVSAQSLPKSITTPPNQTGITVSLSAPLNNSIFTAPASFPISANTSGPVVKVDFLDGTTILGTDTSAPYNFIWNNIPAGAYTLIAKASDNSGGTVSSSVNITVNNALNIPTSSPLPSGTISVSYSTTLSATGGGTPYVWSLTAGSFPPGINMNAQGAITGTPSTAGTFNFTVQVTDNTGAKFSKAFTITIGAQPVITTLSLPTGTVNFPYSKTISATGGTPPLTWTLSSGSLPSGLSLNSSGNLNGTPSSPGAYSFTIQVKDSLNVTGTKTFSLVINAALKILTTSLPNGTAGLNYSQTLSASGGTPPLSWAVTVGVLPAGLSLNSTTGVLNGTPLQAGSYPFTITIQDSVGASALQALAISVVAPVGLSIITPVDLPDGTVNTSYLCPLFASGGTGPYTWSLEPGSSLPPGLSLNSSGNISGTPTSRIQNGVGFTIRVKDSTNATLIKSCFLTINISPNISARTLPNGIPGEDYSDLNNSQTNLLVNGGTPPFVWSITAGLLPQGMSLNPLTAEIDGTPTNTGVFPFTAKATDATGATDSNQFSLTIGEPLSITNVLTLPDAAVGIEYLVTLVGTGGIPPYIWSLPSGSSLPDGLNLDPSGFISGQAQQSGTYNLDIQLTDQSGSIPPETFSLNVRNSFSITSSPSLPNAIRGIAYASTLSAAGGVEPYSWTLASGSLPTGLDLDVTGIISGTPTLFGQFNVLIKVTDINGNSASQTVSFSVTNVAGQSQNKYNSVVNPNLNEVVIIPCEVDSPSHVTINILTMRGETVKNVIDADFLAGDCSTKWDGKNEQSGAVASGVYLAERKIGGQVIKPLYKIVVVK